jgi:hypothetical protein
MTSHVLHFYSNYDNSEVSFLFEENDCNKLAAWVNQLRLSDLRFEVIQLCKRHQNCKGLQKWGKCCKIVDQG